MALVPAKCTQCGGQVEVDDSKEAGICKHCGMPFITEKAITNYVTRWKIPGIPHTATCNNPAG